MDKIDLLLVDDEDDFRQVTSETLSRRGFNIRQAESGDKALQLIDESVPHVVLLDLRMQGKGGIDTLTEIRKKHPDLPVIILTGHGEFESAMDSIRLKVVDFLQKPIDVEKLAALIKKRLDGGKRTLTERNISALMVPVTSYRIVYEDQTVAEVIQDLRDAMFRDVEGKVEQHGHRSILVYDRQNNYSGCLRINDFLDLVLPSFLKTSPYSSYFTGMFLAQCKLIGNQPIRDLLQTQRSIDIHAPLMEAVYFMVNENLINLPVMKDGRLVGVLRDKDILLEIADIVSNR